MAYPPISGRSLSRFTLLRGAVLGAWQHWLRHGRGVSIAENVDLSLSTRFELGRRGAISIGQKTAVALNATISTTREDGTVHPVRIGERCFIGAGSAILPGVTIGDGSIVAVGSVVTKDVPPDCIVSGNPARIVRRGIDAGWLGRLPEAWINQRLMYAREAIKLGIARRETFAHHRDEPPAD
jgi:carbonic anhydrase/acetyltransferase-like protein (isoleucine patch superfamily)